MPPWKALPTSCSEACIFSTVRCSAASSWLDTISATDATRAVAERSVTVSCEGTDGTGG